MCNAPVSRNNQCPWGRSFLRWLGGRLFEILRHVILVTCNYVIFGQEILEESSFWCFLQRKMKTPKNGCFFRKRWTVWRRPFFSFLLSFNCETFQFSYFAVWSDDQWLREHAGETLKSTAEEAPSSDIPADVVNPDEISQENAKRPAEGRAEVFCLTFINRNIILYQFAAMSFYIFRLNLKRNEAKRIHRSFSTSRFQTAKLDGLLYYYEQMLCPKQPVHFPLSWLLDLVRMLL